MGHVKGPPYVLLNSRIIMVGTPEKGPQILVTSISWSPKAMAHGAGSGDAWRQSARKRRMCSWLQLLGVRYGKQPTKENKAKREKTKRNQNYDYLSLIGLRLQTLHDAQYLLPESS